MPEIRSFQKQDLDGAIALYRELFPGPRRRPVAEVNRRFEQLYFESPFRRDGISPMVHVEEDGTITGFIGVVPTSFVIGDRPLIATLFTGLMVSPKSSTMATGPKLVRSAISQGQDFAFADNVSSDDRAIAYMWKRVGGVLAWPFGFEWSLTLRPYRERQRRFLERFSGRRNLPLRFMVLAATPLVVALDKLHSKRRATSDQKVSAEAVLLTPDLLFEAMGARLDSKAIRPAFTRDELAWLLRYFDDYASRGRLRAKLLRLPSSGKPVGWYAGYVSGACFEVVDLCSAPGSWQDVLQHLEQDALEAGAAFLRGDSHAEDLPQLLQRGAVTRRRPRLTFARANDEHLQELIRAGNIQITGLMSERSVPP